MKDRKLRNIVEQLAAKFGLSVDFWLESVDHNYFHRHHFAVTKQEFEQFKNEIKSQFKSVKTEFERKMTAELEAVAHTFEHMVEKHNLMTTDFVLLCKHFGISFEEGRRVVNGKEVSKVEVKERK